MIKLPDGFHILSGYEPFIRIDEHGHQRNGICLIIDNEVYSCEIDPADTWSSYGIVYKPEEFSLKEIYHVFDGVKVLIIGNNVDEVNYGKKEVYYEIKNAVTNKTIIKVGTDYTTPDYPIAIFELNLDNIETRTDKRLKCVYDKDLYNHYMKFNKEELAAMLATEHTGKTVNMECVDYDSITMATFDAYFKFNMSTTDHKYKLARYKYKDE